MTPQQKRGEYVRDQAHTNGIESFWALLKRGYYGTYHKMSEKHLARYIGEFAGRPKARRGRDGSYSLRRVRCSHIQSTTKMW